MSIATKTGDDGTTSLLFGRRVPKTDPRIEANGACDELNAAIGMARAFCADVAVTEPLLEVQKDLVVLMGEVATASEDRERYLKAGHVFLAAAAVERIGALIGHLEKHHQISFRHWATPGACRESALFDLARTVCRRAERALLVVAEAGFFVNPESVRYLNRLSDLLWLLARWVETRLGLG